MLALGSISRILLCSLLIQPIHCWQQWDYSSRTTDEWRQLWTLGDGPSERRGHSITLFNSTKIVLFGGRGNDAHRPHVPRHFDIQEEGGVLEFATHDDMPLSSNYNPESPRCKPVETCVPLANSSSGSEQVCSYSWHHLLGNNPSQTDEDLIMEACGFTNIGVYYNDLWIMDLDCLRYADLSCANDGWRILHPGMTFGGCSFDSEQGKTVCDIPSERYGHGAAMLDDSTLAIYGGYSNDCEDYCDDLWLFDFNSAQWTKVETPLTPGNRWQFSMVSDSNPSSASIYLFGGHRLWHGFSNDNSAENRWRSTELLPKGGYLNDLWVYTPNDSKDGERQWTKIEGKTTCIPAPGLTWESRNDQQCEIKWPSARSGHAAVYDEKRGGMWVHGGFSTYYPYPTSKDAGSGLGTRTLGREHMALQPTFAFYLDDLWFYDTKSGFWEKKRIFGRKPKSRTEHVLSLSGDLLVLHGGFGDNTFFNDTWHYITGENRWLEKNDFVHASYPDTCIDDLATIKEDPSCIELQFPPDLKRSNESTLALKYQDILPFHEQKGYTPDPDVPFYFGIVDDAEELVQELRRKYLEQEVLDDDGNRIWLESTVPDGTPIAPKAATAPRQYARKKMIKYNQTTTLEVWEWCVSVKGEPTRGREDDGKHGRSNTSVYIPQPRRQSPGWDGCRDLEWKYPPSRSDHASVYVDKFDMLVTHGGMVHPSDDDSHPPSSGTRVLSDMWVLNMHNCAHNCSGHGVCTNGFCKCDPGYYGLDCSNVTCPGSVCEYDENNDQHCSHCCYDSINDRKVPCRLEDDELMLFTGTSEGVCDGFGTCQCAPPYIGEDCSILDCKHNCSFNGYCIVEFPQSRCMCKDGYTGEYCQHRECLSNCSFPNGICDQETGSCACAPLYNPYDRTQHWTTWQGPDCSYLPVWSRASHLVGMSPLTVFVLFASLAVLILI